jgi:hypothetical protein
MSSANLAEQLSSRAPPFAVESSEAGIWQRMSTPFHSISPKNSILQKSIGKIGFR